LLNSVFEYQAPGAIDRGKWSHRMLAAQRGTIATGTNEIQHNIIGEHVRPPRAMIAAIGEQETA